MGSREGGNVSGVVWSKFFWSDWANDPALRLCSLAAQGLWMRMLCVAAEHDPIGYVAVAGRGLELPGLARVIGADESEVQILLGELERNGVFSRDRKGRIYSRRMVRDAKKAATARKNGKKGGNPSLSNINSISASDKPTPTGALAYGSLFPDGMREEVTETSARARRWPPDFRERFWEAYPRRVEKSAALRSLERVKASGTVEFEALISAVHRFATAMATAEPKFICHPSVWLNKGRWDDDPNHINPRGNGNGHTNPRPNSIAAAGRRLHAEIVEQYGLGDRPDDTGFGSEAGQYPLRIVSLG